MYNLFIIKSTKNMFGIVFQIKNNYSTIISNKKSQSYLFRNFNQ